MRALRIIPGLVLLLVTCQCTHTALKAADPLLGVYQLTAYDQSGQLAFTGQLKLNQRQGKDLSGNCKIVRDPRASQSISDFTAPCEASIEGTKINFDLAPNMDDAGMLLYGEFESSGVISGNWGFDNFAGYRPRGKFVARKT